MNKFFTQEEILQRYKDAGGILTNTHVCLTPKEGIWSHSDGYVAKDNITKNPVKAFELYNSMAAHFRGLEIDVVIGPAMGAITIAYGVAFHLSNYQEKDALATYTEPENPADKNSCHVLRRGVNDVKGKKVLLVEDVLTSGGSLRRTKEAVIRIEGIIVGAVVLADRGNITAEQLGIPKLVSLLQYETIRDLKFQTWKADECPRCKQGIPLREDVGHGKEWLKKKQLDEIELLA